MKKTQKHFYVKNCLSAKMRRMNLLLPGLNPKKLFELFVNCLWNVYSKEFDLKEHKKF
jgi:hypothetical protein